MTINESIENNNNEERQEVVLDEVKPRSIRLAESTSKLLSELADTSGKSTNDFLRSVLEEQKMSGEEGEFKHQLQIADELVVHIRETFMSVVKEYKTKLSLREIASKNAQKEAEEKYDYLQNKNRELAEAYKQKNDELKEAQKKITDLKNENTGVKIEALNSKERIDELKLLVSEKEKALNSLQSLNDSMKEKVALADSLEEKVVVLVEENAELKKRLDDEITTLTRQHEFELKEKAMLDKEKFLEEKTALQEKHSKLISEEVSKREESLQTTRTEYEMKLEKQRIQFESRIEQLQKEMEKKKENPSSAAPTAKNKSIASKEDNPKK